MSRETVNWLMIWLEHAKMSEGSEGAAYRLCHGSLSIRKPGN